MPEFWDDRSKAREVTRQVRRQWLSIVNEKFPQMQQVLQEVQDAINLNEDGSFQPGDLQAFNAVALEMIQALRAYADSLPGGGAGPST